MKNNIYKSILILFFCLLIFSAYGQDDFNFDVTEIQIKENGNMFYGKKRGTITSTDGITVNADRFEYDKKLNILKAAGKVKVIDTVNDYIIYTDSIIYKKNINKIFTKNNSKAKNLKENIEITATNFEYDILENVITAEKKVILENKIENYAIYSEFLSYLRNNQKIFTKGETTASIHSKYKLKTENLIFLKNSMELISDEETELSDKQNIFRFSKFNFLISSNDS